MEKEGFFEAVHDRYIELRLKRHEKYPAWRDTLARVQKALVKGKNVYVWGAPGVGKTTTLEVTSHQFRQKGIPIGEPESIHCASSSDVYGLLSIAIESAIGIDRHFQKPYEERLTQNIQAIRTSNKKPIVVIDRVYYPEPYAEKGTKEAVAKGMREIIRAGGQILAAGRGPLERIHPSLAPDFQQVHLKSQQVDYHPRGKGARPKIKQ